LRQQEFPHGDSPEQSERYCGILVLSTLVNIAVGLADQRGCSTKDIQTVLDDYRQRIPTIRIDVTSPGGSG